MDSIIWKEIELDSPLLAWLHRACGGLMVRLPGVQTDASFKIRQLRDFLLSNRQYSAVGYGEDVLVTDLAAPVIVIVDTRKSPPSLCVVEKSRFSLKLNSSQLDVARLDTMGIKVLHQTEFSIHDGYKDSYRWWKVLVFPYFPDPIDEVMEKVLQFIEHF